MSVREVVFRWLDGVRVEWCVDGLPAQGSPAELAAVARGRRLVLAVDTAVVRLLLTPRPHRRREVCARAVPYAIEERLAGDVEAQFCALGPLVDPLPVAVVARELPARWLADCAGAGLAPAALVPDALLLPLRAGAWSLWFDGERALVRCGPWLGWVCSRGELDGLLQRALAEAPTPPAALHVWGEGDVNAGVARVREAGHPWRGLAPLRAHAIVDLRQGAFAARGGAHGSLAPWRVPLVLLLLWFGARGALLYEERARLRAEQARLVTAIEQVFRAALPDVRRLVSPRVQMEQRLRERRAAAGRPDGALDRLAALAPLLAAQPELRVRALRFAEGRLEVDLDAPSLEALEALRGALAGVAGARLGAGLRDGRAAGQVVVVEGGR